MQTQNLIPKTGKTYISQKDPSFSVYVESVTHIKDDGDPFFIAQACNRKDKKNPNAIGLEFDPDEWASYNFTQVV